MLSLLRERCLHECRQARPHQERSACTGSHATALLLQRIGMSSLAQAPLERDPVVTPGIVVAWGGEGE